MLIMMALRILWLVVAFVVLLPIIIVVEAIWLVVCIRSAKQLDKPLSTGLYYWWVYLKEGIKMNADFVINGL
jgi:hypothetical protein